MTGYGMCGIFIPDRVLAGQWRSQWMAGDRLGGGEGSQQVAERGRYINACASYTCL